MNIILILKKQSALVVGRMVSGLYAIAGKWLLRQLSLKELGKELNLLS